MGILIDESEYINGRGLSIIIPNETIDIAEFQDLYYNNQEITGSVEFPNLTEIGSYGLESTFKGCRGLTSVEFPNLTKIGSYGLGSTFESCGGLTSVEFPNLKSVSTFGLSSAFGFCTRLTNVSFPALTSVEEHGLNNTFWYSNNISEIHFRADAKSVIEAEASYLSKFGSYSATIYFDL